MSAPELQQLLSGGEELFAVLERETSACLKSLETLSGEEIEDFVSRRQEIIAAILKFDTEFSRCREWYELHGEQASRASLEKFGHWLSAVRQRVIDTDGLLLALARKELCGLQGKLTAIARGRQALHCYNENWSAMEC